MRRRRGGAGEVALLLFIAASPIARASESPVTATADFSGGGGTETIVARISGKSVRLEARDAFGKRLARADAPAPGVRDERVALATGSVGSAGALLEVTASGGGTTCRSVWRLREGGLGRLPIQSGDRPLPDCEGASEWSSRWEEGGNEPARYIRERTRPVAQGSLRETEVFTFVGFELRRDARRCAADINGVAIPEWADVKLYPKSALEALFRRFQISVLRGAPSLRFEADRPNGAFALVLSDPQGDLRLPVTASKPLAGEDPGVELSAGDPPARVLVTLARGSVPQDASVKGFGTRFDGAYAPIIHWATTKIRVYPGAEQELAAEYLPGTWATDRDERLEIFLDPAPGAIRFGDAEFALRLDGAPPGTDLLLVPRNGAPPVWALTLRGPNGLARIPVACAPAQAGGQECRTEGDGEVFRRLGSKMNVR
ncbi:MAG TPA: hypothetical protein VEG84_04135 [Thermoanaerobaculia bacterium]|nr:hypothetical protein [Thermoanaerobaculia bacterium]